MKFGNECYTWFMKESGAYWDGKLDHMIEVTARAGMSGIEPIWGWMGELSDPVKLKESLDRHGISLAAIAFVQDWNHPEETAEEKAAAEEAIAFLKQFPEAVFCTVQMPTGRHELETRRQNLVANVNAVSRRAAEAGLTCSFHPNSPESSINRTEEDYEVIINGLDSEVTGWTPDVGHLINGGMDPLGKMKEFASLINHVHFKDWDGNPEFSLMGEGEVDFVGVTKWLKCRGYGGWVICEDEAPSAVDDPDGVTLHDGKWIRETLLPAVEEG
ncbi:MAG: sugar phosphate isomerase/epimerase family protein [Verrucomicrobiota bacterium JB023]|nr:sugar phosphate isomerase/epimerase family protein [Verrucomicrobiota bacterium JB023]